MIFADSSPPSFLSTNSTQALNLQAITLSVSPTSFILQHATSYLHVNRLTHLITAPENPQIHSDSKQHYFSAFLGIIDIKGKKALSIAEEVLLVASINQRDIFKVLRPIFLFYDPADRQRLTGQEAELLLHTTLLLEQGIYFSYHYDLALPLQATRHESEQKKMFNWAHTLQLPLHGMDMCWKISFIQGFVGRLDMLLNGSKVSIILISRRAVRRAGTQYRGRGIDKQGNAGNYVETEQILVTKDHYFSFLQCRGSAPLFWKQEVSTYGFSMIKCLGSLQDNQVGFEKHIQILASRSQFKWVGLINLLSSSKEEKKLVQNYECLLKRKSTVSVPVKYAYFDIHANCPYKRYDQLNAFIEHHIQPLLHSCGYTTLRVDSEAKKVQVISAQSGILRANCLNCIDRTNIFQSRAAARRLIDILHSLEVNQFSQGLSFIDLETPFACLFRNLWADNGDALSKQHTGTGSTESSAIRNGKLSYLTTIDHGMKSIFRAMRSLTSRDDPKNTAIDFLVSEIEGANTSDTLNREDLLMMFENETEERRYAFTLK